MCIIRILLWFFQEVEISDNIKDRHLLAEDKSLRGECDLHLTNVDFIDDGRYVCQMSNELGSFEQPVNLHILGTYTHTHMTVNTYHRLTVEYRIKILSVCRLHN